jgi:hypothetical protein
MSGLTANHPLARSFLEPLFRPWSAMRAAGPTTGAAFTLPKVLNRALDSAAARCFLLGRDDPTNPFIARQRRQIFPSRLRGCFRAQCHAQVRRGFVHGTWLARFAFVRHLLFRHDRKRVKLNVLAAPIPCPEPHCIAQETLELPRVRRLY